MPTTTQLLLKQFKEYIKNQKLNNYIDGAEENFLLSNSHIFEREINSLIQASTVADFRNDNKTFIRSILKTVMQHLNVIAIA